MDVKEVLVKIGYTDLRETSTHYSTRPLYRVSDNSTALAINKMTGKWYDFVQRIGGTLPQLVQLTLKGISDEQIKEQFGEFTPIYDKHELSHIKKFDKHLLFKLKKDHSYWINRGISERTVEQFEGGTTFNGRMAYRYVFPIFGEKDDLIGFSGRRLNNDDSYAKWKHIGAKTNWLYPLKINGDILSLSKEVILVESIGDMLALYDAGIKNVLVIFGVKISSKITEFLLKIDAKRVIVALNNDEEKNSVGNRAADDVKSHLLKFFDENQIIVSLPESKDFGEMSREQIQIWKTKLEIKSA